MCPNECARSCFDQLECFRKSGFPIRSTTKARTHAKTLPNRGSLRSLYETMALIRAVEQNLLDLFGKGKLRGTVHTGIGQEGIAAGVVAALDLERDIICSNHRGHGHTSPIAATRPGSSPRSWAAPKASAAASAAASICTNATSIRTASWAAWRRSLSAWPWARRRRNPAPSSSSSRATERWPKAPSTEAFNLASLWKLPYMLVIEDNGYAQSTPKALEQAGHLAKRPEPFGIPVVSVDGNDVEAVFEAADGLAARIRAGEGPGVLYCTTYRLAPHSKGDDIRDKQEIAEAWMREPIRLARAKLPPTTARRPTPPSPSMCAPSSKAPMTQQSTSPSTYLQSLNRGLHTAMAANDKVHFAGEDVLDPYGGAFKVSAGLSNRFPARVHTTPISEGAIVGLASGMALRGPKPVVEIMFGDFMTLTFDQILNHAVKFGTMYGQPVDVPMLIRTPMGGRRGYGPTHSQSIEKHFFGIPGLKIISPSHVHVPGELLVRALGTRERSRCCSSNIRAFIRPASSPATTSAPSNLSATAPTKRASSATSMPASPTWCSSAMAGCRPS